MKKQQRPNSLVPKDLLEVLSEYWHKTWKRRQSGLTDQLRVTTKASGATGNLKGELEDPIQKNERADGTT